MAAHGTQTTNAQIWRLRTSNESRRKGGGAGATAQPASGAPPQPSRPQRVHGGRRRTRRVTVRTPLPLPPPARQRKLPRYGRRAPLAHHPGARRGMRLREGGCGKGPSRPRPPATRAPCSATARRRNVAQHHTSIKQHLTDASTRARTASTTSSSAVPAAKSASPVCATRALRASAALPTAAGASNEGFQHTGECANPRARDADCLIQQGTRAELAVVARRRRRQKS